MKTNIPTALSTIVLTASLAGCTAEPKVRDMRIPVPQENQQVLMHPDYLNGSISLGYTILTDMDESGDWDVAHIRRAGFTQGAYEEKMYYKEGFGPAQDAGIPTEEVERGFFNRYQ